ncbi:GtrA family protein [Microbispora sp. NPDC046973]|uniref:GtrA family protein n=1 Tax=Microbispora sp. NPDC046973 TaxID=3155022 RepID=UPI0033FE8AD1
MRGSPFARFLIGGAVNTGVTYALFVILSRWLPPSVAYSLVFLSGIALAYLINTAFVFRTRASVGSAVRFPGVYLVQYLVGLGLLTLLVRLGVDSRAALPLTMCVTVPLTFVMSRHVLEKKAAKNTAVILQNSNSKNMEGIGQR